MDLVDLLKLALRRWYVLVPVLAITLGVAAYMQSNVDREYQARGTLMLATPDLDPARAPRVPVELSDAIAELQTASGMNAIVERGGVDGFSVRRVDDHIVEIRVPGDSSAAETTAVAAMERLSTHVLDRQREAEVPDDEIVVPFTSVAVVQFDAAGQPIDPAAGETDETDETDEADTGEQQEEPTIEAAGETLTIGTLRLEDPAAARHNPYVAGDATSRLLQVAVQSDAGMLGVMERVGNEALLGFEVRPDGGPGIIHVTTTATDPTVTIETFWILRDILADELDRRHERADVPLAHRLEVEVLASPQAPVDITGPLDRAVAATVGLGGLLGIGLVLLVENLSARLERRRHKQAQPEDDQPRLPPFGTADWLEREHFGTPEPSLFGRGAEGDPEPDPGSPRRQRSPRV